VAAHGRARGVPIRGEDGRVREWVGTHADLTDRVGAEHAIREADRQLRRVVDSLPAGAAYVEGSRVAVNSAVERLTGFRRDELATLDAWFGTLFGSRAAAARARTRPTAPRASPSLAASG
jgi:PAS domain-containing protein